MGAHAEPMTHAVDQSKLQANGNILSLDMGTHAEPMPCANIFTSNQTIVIQPHRIWEAMNEISILSSAEYTTANNLEND